MYIEFDLLRDLQTPAGYVHQRITVDLSRWSEQHNNIKYTTKTIKFKYRVCFEDDSLYTFFQLTWPESAWQHYQIVRDLNNRRNLT
jgi:hypothetical protein